MSDDPAETTPPAAWHRNTRETTFIMRSADEPAPGLRALADWLAADPTIVLIAVYNMPEGGLQIVLTEENDDAE